MEEMGGLRCVCAFVRRLLYWMWIGREYLIVFGPVACGELKEEKKSFHIVFE